MDNISNVPHIDSPLLYVFEGELIRIGKYMKENIEYAKYIEAYGEIYGLYTHSHCAVVHVSTLETRTKGTLEDQFSYRLEAPQNDYSLSLMGEWFTTQNTDIPVLEILREKANTLRETGWYFCFVVKTLQTRFDFERIHDHIVPFFLARGNVYRLNMRIIKRESPFRLDPDFTDNIPKCIVQSNGSNNINETEMDGFKNSSEDEDNALQILSSKNRTVCEDISAENNRELSSGNSTPETEGPGKPSDHNENAFPVLRNESKNKECKSTHAENSKGENSDVGNSEPISEAKDDSLEANSVVGEKASDESVKERKSEQEGGEGDDVWANIVKNDYDNAKETEAAREHSGSDKNLTSQSEHTEENTGQDREGIQMEDGENKNKESLSCKELGNSSTLERKDNVVQDKENANQDRELNKVKTSQVENEENLPSEELDKSSTFQKEEVVPDEKNTSQKRENTNQEKENNNQEKGNTNQEKENNNQEKEKNNQEKEKNNQETENTNQKRENTNQETENTNQETENTNEETENTNQKRENTNQETENTNQETENTNEETKNTNQETENTNQETENTNQEKENTNQKRENTNQKRKNTNKETENTNQKRENTNEETENTNQKRENTNQETENTNQKRENTNEETENTNEETENTNQERENTNQETENTNQEKENIRVEDSQVEDKKHLSCDEDSVNTNGDKVTRNEEKDDDIAGEKQEPNSSPAYDSSLRENTTIKNEEFKSVVDKDSSTPAENLPNTTEQEQSEENDF